MSHRKAVLYGLSSPFVSVGLNAPAVTSAIRAPTTADHGTIGDVWVNTTGSISYILTQITGGLFTWSVSSAGSGDLDQIAGDAGTATPVAGVITVVGGTNVTTAGAGGNLTVDVDDAITLVTSVTSPLYTAGAGVDTFVEAVAGQDIVLNMSTNDGSTNVLFTDSDDATVFSVDSNGGLPNLGAITTVGAFTQTGGAVSISEDNAANAVGIANGNTARAIDIGSSAAAHTITIGSATGAASLDLLAGTGNFTLEGAVATTYNISATGANTGTCTFGAGTGARIVNLGTGAVGVKTINIGTDAIGNIITVGTVTAAASLDLLCGTGNFTLEGDVTSTYDISNTGVNTGTVNIAGGTGARAINIGAGGTGAKTIGIGAAASADVITIGDATGAGSLDLVCGTGNFTLEGNVATTYDISSTGANTGTCTFGAGTGARIVNLGTGAVGVKTINIGTDAIGNIITVGTVTAAASLDLLCGTGNFTLEGDVASTYSISATGVNTGTCTFGAGTGARIVNLGTGAGGAKTINIGTAAIGNLITVGTVTAAASLDLLCGTGNFTLEGDVASTYDISGTGVNTGTITIGGGTGAQTLNMMNSTGIKTVNIASGAAANVVTLGSTNGAASLTLQSGTGEITVTGTVKEITSEFTTRSGDSITFQGNPILQAIATTGAAPVGTINTANIMMLQEGISMESYNVSAQTIICPRCDANGLLVSLDQGVGEGAEYNWGAARNNSRHAFTIGTSAAFFFELQFRINDMDGAEPYIFGFRRVEANNAVWNAYTDFASMGMIASSSVVNIVLATELNSAGTTITDTTDAWGGDTTTNTLTVLVSGAGVVTYLVNGVAPSATAAFTFDNADIIVPYIRVEHSASATDVHLVSMQVGFQA